MSIGGGTPCLDAPGRRGLKPRLPDGARSARACPSPCSLFAVGLEALNVYSLSAEKEPKVWKPLMCSCTACLGSIKVLADLKKGRDVFL